MTCLYLAFRLYRGLGSFFTGVRFWPVLASVIACALISMNIKHIFTPVSGYCMGLFFYLFLFTVVSDIMLLVPLLLRLPFTTHHLYRGCVMLAVLLLTVITCIYGALNAQRIYHVSYDIKLEGRDDLSRLNLVMISDLHLGATGSEGRLEKVVSAVNALEPDVLCIAGDFFDNNFSAVWDPESVLGVLRRIKTKYGIYACLGNHDAGRTFGQMVDFLERAGIQVLEDDYAVIDGRLALVGRLDGRPIGGFGGLSRKALSDFFVRPDGSMPVVVLDHDPKGVDGYGDEADLVLCGHTHRGQVFPFPLITRKMFPVDYGYYRKDDSSPQVVVSSGVGYWGMPMRVGTHCEVVSIHFVQ